MSGLTKEQHLRIAIEYCEDENLRLQADHAAQREVNLALVAELSKVAAELAAEKARLDWLERQEADVVIDSAPGPDGVRRRVTWKTEGLYRRVEGADVRRAIDAAREADGHTTAGG